MFHGRPDTLSLVNKYTVEHHPDVKAEYTSMDHWSELPMFVVVAARKGTVSYKNAIEYLPEELTTHFSGTNLMIIFPDQHGNAMDEMTFAQPQHTEDRSAYESIGKWINRMKKSGKNRADGNDAQ